MTLGFSPDVNPVAGYNNFWKRSNVQRNKHSPAFSILAFLAILAIQDVFHHEDNLYGHGRPVLSLNVRRVLRDRQV